MVTHRFLATGILLQITRQAQDVTFLEFGRELPRGHKNLFLEEVNHLLNPFSTEQMLGQDNVDLPRHILIYWSKNLCVTKNSKIEKYHPIPL